MSHEKVPGLGWEVKRGDSRHKLIPHFAASNKHYASSLCTHCSPLYHPKIGTSCQKGKWQETVWKKVNPPPPSQKNSAFLATDAWRIKREGKNFPSSSSFYLILRAKVMKIERFSRVERRRKGGKRKEVVSDDPE